MQKTLTPLQQSQDDQFADDAEEVDISLSSVSIRGRPLYNLQFPDDILEGGEEDMQQVAEWARKQLLITAWKSAPTNQNPHQQHKAKAIHQ